MKKSNFSITIFLMVFLLACNNQPSLKPPVADKIPHELFDKRVDNYFWMSLSDQQKSDTNDEQTKKVLDYLNMENEYSKAVLKNSEGLQKTVYNEIVGRIKKDDESVPYLDNGYYYYNKYSEGSEYPVYFRKKGTLDAREELLLDVNKLADGKEYCAVSGLTVSRDNKLLVYGTDFVSRRRYTLNFLNLETGLPLSDKIENTTGQAVWAADNKTVFYVTKDMETLRQIQLYRHRLGTPMKVIRKFTMKRMKHSVLICQKQKAKNTF